MKAATIKKRNIARELTKGYIRLLTAAVAAGKAIDEIFIGEEDSEIRPYFYGSIAFGVAVSLLIYIAGR